MNGDTKSLDMLRELTHSLNTLPHLINRQENNFINYNTADGNCIGTGLLYKKEIAVQDCFQSSGSTFPEHTHACKEWLVCYEGSFELTIEGIAKTYKSGDMAYIPSGKSHSYLALEDTHVIGITIPADEGYPNDRQK